MKLAQFLAAQPIPLKHYVALTDAAHLPADTGINGLVDYEGLIADEPDTFDWPQLDENTASSLCYTSGTAGFPEGRALFASLDRDSFVRGVHAGRARHLLDATSLLPVVPMFHVNAWGVPYAAAMTGAKLVLPGAGPRSGQPAGADRKRTRHEPAWRADRLDGAARACPRAGQAAVVGQEGRDRRLGVPAEHD